MKEFFKIASTIFLVISVIVSIFTFIHRGEEKVERVMRRVHFAISGILAALSIGGLVLSAKELKEGRDEKFGDLFRKPVLKLK